MGVSVWMKCLIWCLKIICSSVLAWITLLVCVRTHKKVLIPAFTSNLPKIASCNRLEMFCNKFGKEFGSNELFLSMWNLKETRTEKCVAQFVRWEVCHWTLLWKRISLWYYCSVFRKKRDEGPSVSRLIITITIPSNVIVASAALHFTDHSVKL